MREDLAIGAKLAGDSLARSDRTNASGGSSQYDIAFLKLHNRRDVLDQVGNLEDHILGVSVLLRNSIDLELKIDIVGVLDLLLGDKVSNGREGIVPLGSAPGKTLFLGGLLQVTSSHIQGQCVSCDVLVSVLGRDVATILADHHGEFNLVMNLTASWDLNVLSVRDEGRCRLQEKEWGFGDGVAELFGVFTKVATDRDDLASGLNKVAGGHVALEKRDEQVLLGASFWK